MRLLVSVADAADAAAALAGGADLIDAKDPTRGALGAVSHAVLRDICAAVAGARPITAALGDATDDIEIEEAARRAAESGVEFVKIGFDSINEASRISSLIAAAVRGVSIRGATVTSTGVVAVVYADGAGPVAPVVIDAAARAGARGVLIDTANKHGPGLCQLMTREALAAWVTDVHNAGLFAAVAGKLTADDLSLVRTTGADIAGVRGAACDGGRNGRVVAGKVVGLREPAARLDLVG